MKMKITIRKRIKSTIKNIKNKSRAVSKHSAEPGSRFGLSRCLTLLENSKR